MNEATATEPKFEMTDVVEIVEMRSHRIANIYLAAGYRLLNISNVHTFKRVDGQKHPAIWRLTEYVVGRTSNVDAILMQDAVAQVRIDRELFTSAAPADEPEAAPA